MNNIMAIAAELLKSRTVISISVLVGITLMLVLVIIVEIRWSIISNLSPKSLKNNSEKDNESGKQNDK
ncbi:hypothetical protein ACFL2K_03840 [Candidatus Margulisiibacteriota bacterium]